MSIVENGSAVLPYDRHVGRYSPALATRLIDRVGVRPGWRALDVGCGTGALTAALAQLLGAGRVAAVDPSPTAVEVCGERVPVADVRLAPAEQLPFEFARALGSPLGRFRLHARAWYVVGTAPA